jgi:Ca2+-transporting ATPase
VAEVTVSHARVPGRVRFRIDRLRRSGEWTRRLERLVAGLGGVRQSSASPLTGTLLVHHTPELETEQLRQRIAAIMQELLGLQAAQPEAPPLGANVVDLAERRQTADQPHPPPPPGTRWEGLSIKETARSLGTSGTRGLSRTEADARLAADGPNQLAEERLRPPLEVALDQVASLPVALLGLSAGVSVMTGGVADAAVILGVVAVNAAIGYTTERGSERIIHGLNHTTPPRARVVRSGRARTLSADQVVRGDLVDLSAGDLIPADLRLTRTHRFSVDESSLTGESLPVEKRADFQSGPETPLSERRNMVYMGTQVTGGTAQGLAVATGTRSEIGQVQAMLGSARSPTTPMERQLGDLGRTLALISGGVCVGVFALGLLRGQGALTMLKSAVSLAVAAVPEGLPTVATTTLAMGIRDMRRRNVAVRQLGAVETLGSVQVLCLDKTGTLTLNRMSLVAAQAGGQHFAVREGRFHGESGVAEPGRHPVLAPLLETVALCSEVQAEPGKDGASAFTGSATEVALVDGAREAGLDPERLWRERPTVRVHPRSEGRPYMTTLHKLPGGDRLLAVKGSPAEVLERCTSVLGLDGPRPLAEAERRALIGRNEDLAGDGLRVLGVARRKIAANGEPETRELEWLGLVGLADPVRSGTAGLIRQFHRAGIKTVMITGDQSATAYAIGRELGLAGDKPLEVLDSSRLERMDARVLAGVVDRVHIFSRVSPAHKLRIVQAFQEAGRVVAMTGDGVNDGPALKAADIGVAMGASGTEVARSVADVVLEDDQLATMVVAVQRGRATYGNIRKTIRFLLATNFSEIQVMALGTGLGMGQVLNPMQLLWINLVTDIFPGLALSLEPPEPDLLDRAPRDPAAPIIGGRDLRRISLESLVITAGSLAAYADGRRRHGPGPAAGTHLFSSLTLAQLLHTLSARSEAPTLLRRNPANPYLTWALGGSLGAQVLAGALPPLRSLLGTTAIGWRDGLAIAAGAGTPLLVNEATKGWPRGGAGPETKQAGEDQS